MKNLLFSLFALLALAAPSLRGAQAAPFDHEHKLWSDVLAKHVENDRFDYAGLKKERAKLDEYLAQLRAVTPSQVETWTREQRYAFWINTYNANCIALVLTEYPVESIKDIGGWFSSVWKKAFIDMPAFHPSGKPKTLSLDDIEHSILRPSFKDARVHAAVNCASLSCPALRNEAFVATRLEAQLDDAVRKWLADASRNRFVRESSRVELSEIFRWFKDDFEREGGVQAWIAKFAPPEHAEWVKAAAKLQIGFLDYSWKLNDVAK
jgi:hypothetical protein